jgi:hypothetical protein
VKLGGWNFGSERSQREADELADKMRPVMEELAPLLPRTKRPGRHQERDRRRLVSGDSLAANASPSDKPAVNIAKLPELLKR